MDDLEQFLADGVNKDATRDALDFLNEMAPLAPAPTPETVAKERTPKAPPTRGKNKQPESKPPPAPVIITGISGDDPTASETGSSIMENVSEAISMPVIGGIPAAFNGMLGLGDMMQEMVPLPGYQFFNEQGQFEP